MKILLSGPSGCGKTFLCEKYSDFFNISFLKVDTLDIFKKYKINSQLDIIELGIKNPDLTQIIYQELIDLRLSLINSNLSFISDRSPLDNIIYYLLQHSYFNKNADSFIEDNFEKIKTALSTTCNIILPSNQKFLVENGVRLTNVSFNNLYKNVLLIYANKICEKNYKYLEYFPDNITSRINILNNYLLYSK